MPAAFSSFTHAFTDLAGKRDSNDPASASPRNVSMPSRPSIFAMRGQVLGPGAQE